MSLVHVTEEESTAGRAARIGGHRSAMADSLRERSAAIDHDSLHRITADAQHVRAVSLDRQRRRMDRHRERAEIEGQFADLRRRERSAVLRAPAERELEDRLAYVTDELKRIDAEIASDATPALLTLADTVERFARDQALSGDFAARSRQLLTLREAGSDRDLFRLVQPLPPIKVGRDIPARLAALAEERATHAAALATNEAAPRPLEEVEERLDRWLDSKSASIDDRIGARFAYHGPLPSTDLGLAAARSLYHYTDADSTLIALARPLVRQMLLEQATRFLSENPPGLPEAARAERTAELQVAILRCEREEETLIRVAAGQGLILPRRGDARPEIVLARSAGTGAGVSA